MNEMELDLLTGLIPRSRFCSSVQTWRKSSLLLSIQRATGSTRTRPIDNARGRRDVSRVRLRGGTRPPRGLCVIHGRCRYVRSSRRWFRFRADAVATHPFPARHKHRHGHPRSLRVRGSLIPLQTRLRYTTMIVLPEGEEILDVICGDKDFWVISSTQNIAHVKPAKEGATTNLNLVTASGAVYSFLLTEKSGAALPTSRSTSTPTPAHRREAEKYYSAAQVETCRRADRGARAIERAAKRRDESIAAYQQQYPSRLQFLYGP